MTLQGKGMMIWMIPRAENGDAEAIANVAKAAGLSHVLIKIADGPYAFNVDKTTKVDLIPPVAKALKAKGIQVWGWHYVYGNNPVGEAQIAIKRCKELGIEGYVIDAESEYKEAGKEAAAKTFMSTLRSGLPSLPVALCSYRFPTLHPQLPWKAFLDKCDINMPQVYWQSAHNPGAQLARTVKEFQAMTPIRPIVPTGPVYKVGDWQPTPSDIVEFMSTAQSLNLSAVNYFEWYYGRVIMKPVWDAIASYKWDPAPTKEDYPATYIKSLNARDINNIVQIYRSNCVHITADKTIQGTSAIKNWYSTLLTQKLPKATFELTGYTGSKNIRHFTWRASSSSGRVENGQDTFGILNNSIAYHFSYFTIQK